MQAKPTTLPSSRSITYGQYLASREWALRKRAVRARSLGWCEHCHKRAATEVHHLTYERLFGEQLSDLLHVCRPCHQFFSAVTDVDPASVCCTPDEAREWAALVKDDLVLYELALAHLREVEDAWLE